MVDAITDHSQFVGILLAILGLLGGLVTYYARRLENGRKAFVDMRLEIAALKENKVSTNHCEGIHEKVNIDIRDLAVSSATIAAEFKQLNSHLERLLAKVEGK